MKIKIIHPLWVHLPAIAALVIFIGFIISASPLPTEVPVHFSFDGEPDRYGSPWSNFGLIIGLSVFFILLSVFLDELWARQEKSKTFNWLSLMDDIVVGAMAGLEISYLSYIQSGAATFDFPWDYIALYGGGATFIAIILALLRPYHPSPVRLVAQDSPTLAAAVTQRLKDNSPFVYWDYQNPLYVSIISIGLPLVMLAGGIISGFSQLWVSILLVGVGILMVVPHGGQRTIVTREDIKIRWGIFGLRVLRLKISEIVEAGIHEFSPLRDFGGYGVRFNREMKAYFLRGTRGVKFTMTNGKKYLIGSDHPEQMHAVVSSLISANTRA
jgi:hypothetical protein